MRNKSILRGLLSSTFLLAMSVLTFAQQKIGSNPGSLNPGAILELESTNRGFLLPRVDLGTSPTIFGLNGGLTLNSNGMIVYNTNTTLGAGYYVWSGTTGTVSAPTGGAWSRIFTGATTNGLAYNSSNGTLLSTVNGTTASAVFPLASDGTTTSARGLITKSQYDDLLDNIYNSNGTLSDDRTVTLDSTANKTLTFRKGGLSATKTTAAESLPILRLRRDGVTNLSYQQNVEFSIGKYLIGGTTTTDANTQFDIRLNNGPTNDVSDSPVMSLRGNGNVGIGIEAPTQKLHVAGGALISSLSGTGIRMVTASSAGVLSTQTIPTGTLTSVGLTMPSIFSVTNSPVTTAGSLTATLAPQAVNSVFAGPTTGTTTATPGFRALVADDIPTLPINKLAVGTSGQILQMSAGTGTTPTWVTPSATNSQNIYTTDGALGGARTVTQNANALTFSGTGYLNKFSNSTASPAALTVGRTSTEAEFGIAGGTGQGFTATSAGDVWLKSNINGGGLFLGTAGTGAELHLMTNNAERMVITPGGDVGITGLSGTGIRLVTASSAGVLSTQTMLDLSNISGTLPLTKLTVGTSGQILQMSGGTTTTPTWVTPSATNSQNIYTTNGTLTGPRSISMGTTVANQFTMAFDTTTLVVDAKINKIGIGVIPNTNTRRLQIAGGNGDGIGIGNWYDSNVGYAQLRTDNSGNGVLELRTSGNDNATQFVATGNSYLGVNGGNFGIGTISPSQKLHVDGGALISSLSGTGIRLVTASATGVVSTQAVGTSGQILQMSAGTATTPTWVTPTTANSLNIYTTNGTLTQNRTVSIDSASTLTLAKGLTSGGPTKSTAAESLPILRLRRDGVTNLSYQQNVEFSIGKYLIGGTTTTDANTQFDIRLNNGPTNDVSDSPVMSLRGNGNVGIGIEAPTQKLHVAGGALISSLSGTGIRMVTASSAGVLSTQAISPVTAVTTGTGLTLTSGTLSFTPTTAGSLNIYTTNGTIQGLRIVTQDNDLTFSGTGNLHKRSGSTTSAAVLTVGRTSTEAEFGIAGGTGQGFTATSAGDVWLKSNINGGNLFLGTAGTGAELSLMTNNAERMVIAPDGNVGIGTTASTFKLDVAGTVRSLISGTTASPAGSIELSTPGGDPGIIIRSAGTTGTTAMSLRSNMTRLPEGLLFDHSTTGGLDPTFFIQNDNNVGIGTTAPTQKLHVAGGALISSLSGTGIRMVTASSAGVLSVQSMLDLSNISGTLPLAKLTVGTSGQILQMSAGTTTTPTWVTPSATNSQNIYTTDGTLGGSREVNKSTNTLTFSGSGATIFNGGDVRNTAEDVALSWDAGINKRLGFVKKTGLPPFIAFGSGTPLTFASAPGANMDDNIGSSSTAYTTRMSIGTTGAVTINGLSGTGIRLVTASATGVVSTQAVGTSGQILQMSAGTGTTPTWVTPSATNSQNIYTTDGTLGNNRIVGQGDFNLQFTNGTGKTIFGSFGNATAANNTATLGYAGRLAAITDRDARPAFSVMNDSISAVGNRAEIAFRTQGSLTGFGNAASIAAIQTNAATAATDLFFATYSGSANTTERMRITGGGNVGIGTSDPTSRLHVAGGSILFDNLNNRGKDLQITTGHRTGASNPRIISNDTLELQVVGTPHLLVMYAGTTAHPNGRVSIGSYGTTSTALPIATSTLDVNGSISYAIRKITQTTGTGLVAGSRTVGASDRTVLVNTFANTAGIEIILPEPSTCSGREYLIRKVDESSNAVTFTFTGITNTNAIRVSDTSASAGAYINSLNYMKTLRIQSDGTDWVLID